MDNVTSRVLDAIDIETFLVCESENEAKTLMAQLMQKIGLNDINMVFIEQHATGARVRARGYLYKPGDRYGWLNAD
jgi:hypothetical protein